MSLFKSKKDPNGRYAPKTVQESIPLVKCFRNGVIETVKGTYSKAYRMEDVNFKIAPANEQVDVFTNYGIFLNTFSSSVRFQIVIINHSESKLRAFQDIQFTLQRDDLNKYRSEYNRMLIDRMTKSKNSVTQEKYLVTSVDDDNVDHAMSVLLNLEQEVQKAIRKVSKDAALQPVSTEEYLEVLFDIYNQGEGSFYTNDIKNKRRYLNPKLLYKMGMNEKDVIAPSGLEFHAKDFMTGQTFGRTLFVSKIPSYLTTDFISDIADNPCSMVLSLNYRTLETSKAIKQIERHRQAIMGQIAEQQKAAVRNNYSIDLLSPELMMAKEETVDLLHDIQKRDQKLFDIVITIAVFGKTKDELEANTSMLINIANQHSVSLMTLFGQQEYGLNTTLPFARVDNLKKLSRMYTTESASVYIPYTSQEINQKNGLFYGTNQITQNPIIFSRMTGPNYNGIIFGESGQGKSFNAKLEMTSVILRDSTSVVYIIDPEGEYTPLVKALHGEVIDVSPQSSTYINPMDMSVSDVDPLAMKSDYIISMLEIMCGKDLVLTPQAKSIVDQCIKKIYQDYMEIVVRDGKSIDREKSPTLYDLYNELKLSDEPAAKSIADTLAIYTTGSYSTFAHRSNVNSNNRIVAYNIKNLGTGMKDLGLFFCLNDIWNKMIENRKKNIFTYFYIDEFYLLLRSQSTASFLMEIWKRARKWYGVPTGIMQNTEDLLKNEEGRNILNNTNFIRMLSLPKIDRANLGDLLSIPDSQLSYITNAGKGRGLLYNGKTILPFDNTFPRDTQLYSLISSSEKTEDSANHKVNKRR